MQRARYFNKNLGHFGLSSKFYLHFTSPIRRYSDLIVHRMLGKSIEKFMSSKEKEKYGANLEVISSAISRTERVADKLEEESVKIKLIEYMQDKIGNVFIARLSGMNKNKIFMELEEKILNLYIEKMLENNSLESILNTISPLVRRKGISRNLLNIYLDEFYTNGSVEVKEYPKENTIFLVDKFKKYLEDNKEGYVLVGNTFVQR